MKKILFLIATFILPITLLHSCGIDDDAVEKGLLSVQAFNHDYIAIDDQISKASSTAPDSYNVSIAQILTGEVVYKTTYGDIKTSPLAIQQGMYRVSAYNIPIVDAAWDTPRYAGAHEVTVKAGRKTDVQIECLQSNAKVTVGVDDLFKNIFTVNSIVISHANGAKLEYVGNENKAGYFTPGNLTITVQATRKSDGTPKIVEYPLGNIESATWYKVTVNIKLYANTGFDIVVQNEVAEEHTTEIDPNA